MSKILLSLSDTTKDRKNSQTSFDVNVDPVITDVHCVLHYCNQALNEHNLEPIQIN